MDEKLIAPCGMNCGLCISYLAMKNNLKKKGFHKKYCKGCLPEVKKCSILKEQCDLLRSGEVRFCYECTTFPCERLKRLDKRYRAKYHMSMMDNLVFIKDYGIEKFLEKEQNKWSCKECGEPICCHNGLCLQCHLDILQHNKKYCWDENEDTDKSQYT